MARRKKNSRRNFPYLLIGLTVVVLLITIVNNFFIKNNKTDKASTNAKTSPNKKANTSNQHNYIVKAGDNLWNIAEQAYGSGYNAYDIAAANKISDPNLISVNQKLILPSITPKTPTKGEILLASSTTKITITGASYTVKADDNLWNIAEQAYGDGYAWVRIAKANNLANPDIIHKGNILTLPR